MDFSWERDSKRTCWAVRICIACLELNSGGAGSAAEIIALCQYIDGCLSLPWRGFVNYLEPWPYKWFYWPRKDRGSKECVLIGSVDVQIDCQNWQVGMSNRNDQLTALSNCGWLKRYRSWYRLTPNRTHRIIYDSWQICFLNHKIVKRSGWLWHSFIQLSW